MKLCQKLQKVLSALDLTLFRYEFYPVGINIITLYDMLLSRRLNVRLVSRKTWKIILWIMLNFFKTSLKASLISVDFRYLSTEFLSFGFSFPDAYQTLSFFVFFYMGKENAVRTS